LPRCAECHKTLCKVKKIQQTYEHVPIVATHNGVVKELVLCSVAIKSLYILAKKPFSIFEVLKLVFVL
jgi:hypothetical protein